MNDFKVFPNPVTDHLYIEPGLSPDRIFRLEVLSSDGSVLKMRKLTGESYIDLSDLPPSVYILRISIDGMSKVLKLVKS